MKKRSTTSSAPLQGSWKVKLKNKWQYSALRSHALVTRWCANIWRTLLGLPLGMKVWQRHFSIVVSREKASTMIEFFLRKTISQLQSFVLNTLKSITQLYVHGTHLMFYHLFSTWAQVRHTLKHFKILSRKKEYIKLGIDTSKMKEDSGKSSITSTLDWQRQNQFTSTGMKTLLGILSVSYANCLLSF